MSNEPRHFILRTEQIKRRLCEVLNLIPIDEENIQEVVIRPYKRNRSKLQNHFYWVILGLIAREIGTTKDELHETYKERFLVPIYERDDPEYAKMMETVRDVWRKGMKTEARTLRKQVIGLTSTTNATVAQMQEYLNEIESHANSLGIFLPPME